MRVINDIPAAIRAAQERFRRSLGQKVRFHKEALATLVQRAKDEVAKP